MDLRHPSWLGGLEPVRVNLPACGPDPGLLAAEFTLPSSWRLPGWQEARLACYDVAGNVAEVWQSGSGDDHRLFTQASSGNSSSGGGGSAVALMPTTDALPPVLRAMWAAGPAANNVLLDAFSVAAIEICAEGPR